MSETREEYADKVTILSGLKEINRRKKAGLTLERKRVLSNYEWTCEGQITQEEAQELMRKSGYPPEGYGFWGFRFITGKTEWQSSNHC
jgi:hypothetical protein